MQLEPNYLYDLAFTDLRGISRRVHVRYLGSINMSQSKSVYQPGYKFQLIDENGDNYHKRMNYDEDDNLVMVSDENYDNLRMVSQLNERDNIFMLGVDQMENGEFQILPNVLVENQKQLDNIFNMYNVILQK